MPSLKNVQSQSFLKPRDLFKAKSNHKLPPIVSKKDNQSSLLLNPYEDSSDVHTNLFRSVKLDQQLHGIKNKNLRISLEVKQLGKDIYDNVL